MLAKSGWPVKGALGTKLRGWCSEEESGGLRKVAAQAGSRAAGQEGVGAARGSRPGGSGVQEDVQGWERWGCGPGRVGGGGQVEGLQGPGPGRWESLDAEGGGKEGVRPG